MKEKGWGLVLKLKALFIRGLVEKPTLFDAGDLTKTITDEARFPSFRMKNIFQFKSEFAFKLLEFLLKRLK